MESYEHSGSISANEFLLVSSLLNSHNYHRKDNKRLKCLSLNSEQNYCYQWKIGGEGHAILFASIDCGQD